MIKKRSVLFVLTLSFGVEVALISACLYFWVIVYENCYILTWIFMITFLIWKALKWNCLLVVFRKLPEISKKWLLLDSQNVLANWLHPVFDVYPKKKKKKDAFKEVIILHDSSATDFTLGNLLFVTTLVFICQYLWPSYEAISCHSVYMFIWKNIHRKTKISPQIFMLNLN